MTKQELIEQLQQLPDNNLPIEIALIQKAAWPSGRLTSVQLSTYDNHLIISSVEPYEFGEK